MTDTGGDTVTIQRRQSESESLTQSFDFILFYDFVYFIWNTSCSQDNTRKSYIVILIMTYFQCGPLMTCGGLEREVAKC